MANSPIADVSWRTPARPPKYLDLLQQRKQLLDSNMWWKTTTYNTIFLCGINRRLSRLDILHMKDITDGISGTYTGTYKWELKYVSHPTPSLYVDSGMDVVVFLSWQLARCQLRICASVIWDSRRVLRETHDSGPLEELTSDHF